MHGTLVQNGLAIHHVLDSPQYVIFISPLERRFSRRVPRERLPGLIGRKNTGVAEIGRLGVPVPHAFALTREATATILTPTVVATLRDVLKEVDYKSAGTVERSGAQLRRIILRQRLPRTLKQAVSSAYGVLCEIAHSPRLAVSVRSSAVMEDMEEYRFAGVYSSFLNVIGEQEILRSIRKCISSMYSDEAIRYRYLAGASQDPQRIGMCVGVYELIEAKCAGTAFTKDILTGDEKSVIINANWGLGKSVVDGLTQTDRVIVSKSHFKVIDYRIGKKMWEVIPDKTQGTKVIRIDSSRESSPVLTDAESIEIAKYSRAIEKHFKSPVDVEWAIDQKSNIRFLQARPLG
jgi:pyruvate,water dikinase